jgi:hypothetical protein
VQHPEKPCPIDTPMYYILKPAVDTEETGHVFPAVESYDGYDFNAPNSVHKLNFREFPDFTPDIRFKLTKDAKFTDMLSQAAISAHGFLINEKLKNTFEQFNIVPHKYYPARVEDHQGDFHNYFWMHLVWKDRSVIDWSSSKFFYSHYDEKITLNLKSPTDFEDKKKQLGMFTPIQIELLRLNPTNFNMILHPIHALTLVDEGMKNTLSISYYTGLHFEAI